MQNLHNSLLAARHAVYEVEVLDQADRAAAQVDRAILRIWRALLTVIAEDYGTHNYTRALAVLRQFPFAVAGTLRKSLSDIYVAGHDAAARATVEVVPLRLLRQAGPVLEDAPGLVRVTPTGPEPVAKMPTTDEEKQRIRELMFPAPEPSEVLDRLGPMVAPAGWAAIGGDTEKKLPQEIAQAIAVGIAQGRTQREIADGLLPYFDGSRARATRTARTFGMMVAHEGRMRAYDQIGDMLVGYQIHATRDENTRPEHAARDGTIYYVKPGPGQKGVDEMPRPPREADGSMAWNCRCWTSPVLEPIPLTVEKQAVFTNAARELVPDPVDYSEWFNRASEAHRAKAVGVRRYFAARDRLDRDPVYADFLDPETGKLLPVDEIKRETDIQQVARRTQVDSLTAQRQQQIREVLTFGFEQPPPTAPTPTPTPTAPRLPPALALKLVSDRFRELSYEEIEAHVAAIMGKLTAAEAVAVARSYGLRMPRTRAAAIRDVTQAIFERKESWERIQFRPAG